MARKHRILGGNAGELNLTAMIDVAFQLLAFFIITIRPFDVIANIHASRPSPAPEPAPPPMVRITVEPGGYTLNEEAVDFAGMEGVLKNLARRAGTERCVLIRCGKDSVHAQLIRVLDLCAGLKMTNLSVVSSN